MNKKELFVPFLAIGLGLLFSGICVAVFLSGGKSKKWVARKMKIGGLLLTLTAASCNGTDNFVISCYDPVFPNSISLKEMGSNGVEIFLDTNNVLSGTIYEASGSDFSFKIYDQNENSIQQGLLEPVDGLFDSGQEEFKLAISTSIQPGTYSLLFYDCTIENQEDLHIKENVTLTIKPD